MDNILHPLLPKLFFFPLSARGPTRRRNSTGLAELWDGVDGRLNEAGDPLGADGGYRWLAKLAIINGSEVSRLELIEYFYWVCGSAGFALVTDPLGG